MGFIGNHHRVAAKGVSKIKRGRPATSVHSFVLAVFRAPCSIDHAKLWVFKPGGRHISAGVRKPPVPGAFLANCFGRL